MGNLFFLLPNVYITLAGLKKRCQSMIFTVCLIEIINHFWTVDYLHALNCLLDKEKSIYD